MKAGKLVAQQGDCVNEGILALAGHESSQADDEGAVDAQRVSHGRGVVG